MSAYLPRLLLLCLAWLAVFPALAQGVIHLILSEPGGAYMEAAEAFRSGLGNRRGTRLWHLDDLSPAQAQAMARNGELMVPIGVRAARFVADQHGGRAPVLTLMLPRAVADGMPWPASLSRGQLSHVYIDQPANRILGLIEAIFPVVRRVGVVHSQENQAQVRSLGQEAGKRRLELLPDQIGSAAEVASALRRILPASDILLLIPDSLAITAGNAQNVLLTTYRYRIPVVGFSQGLTKAGAVASVYSSPGQIGRHGAQMALRWLADEGDLPPPQPATEFSINFNPRVARSLGLSLPDEDETRRKLGARDE